MQVSNLGVNPQMQVFRLVTNIVEAQWDSEVSLVVKACSEAATQRVLTFRLGVVCPLINHQVCLEVQTTGQALHLEKPIISKD